MKRRQLLAATVPTVSGIMSGCLGSSLSCTDEENWPPAVRVEDLELAPGGSEVLDIQAKGITSFQFDAQLYQCGSADAPVRFGDVETSPEIDYQVDSCPPIWRWDNCTSVTVNTPVNVAPDAATGEYEYGFRIEEDIGEHLTKEYEYAITVTEN